jgi:hypothetical protein
MMPSFERQYEIYVDGEYADYFASATEWDGAAAFIENNTPANTPLRLLAELGETHRPGQAAVMLSDLLEYEKPAPEIAHALRHLHRFLTGDHVLITDGVINET